ncbi:S-formylglutathione hydrolase [Sitodiplosis mosellana]|uniref:S-formylglutathione hydrolase n=1 Tax=Sitodiplosis mosellana TaxID=263140 RepID=UPI0024440EE4|nr:S-formylglutathione hydrolase [Sitodiplosis mosellana]
MTQIKLLSSNKSFGGYQKIYSHFSKELDCEMKFAIYLPPQSETATKLPVLYWLSGLTCNENNFIQKAGAQSYAASHGIIMVCPDTSPRGTEIAKYDVESYDLGSGAGFYVDAITYPWNRHYKMFTYVTKEIVEVINHNFPTVEGLQSIMGHSMGGHGALISALRCPGLYRSVSAFAPIANPTQCQWGQKAFTAYIGEDKTLWNEWDATELVQKYKGPQIQLYIDLGSDDQFLQEKQLLPENLIEACRKSRIGCIYNLREGYDHSYFFIASFVGEHIAYHAKFLKE